MTATVDVEALLVKLNNVDKVALLAGLMPLKLKHSLITH